MKENYNINNDDWFIVNSEALDIGACYEDKAVKDHKYFVEVKSRHLLRKAKELYGDIQNLICLDLGCGTAETVEYFQNEFMHTIGCDYSFGMLKVALQKSLKNVSFVHSLSEKLPFKNNSIDIILLYGMLHHIDSVEKIKQTLNEIRRVLKANGMVAVYEFNTLNPVSRHILNTCKIDAAVHLDGHKKSVYPSTFNSWEISSILKNSGFKISKLEYLIFFPRFLSFFLAFERLFAKIPMGGMYSIFGIK